MLGSNPIRIGASTVAPNIAITCCTPITVVCGHGKRSSGPITPPCCSTSDDLAVQSNIPISRSLFVWRDAMGYDRAAQGEVEPYNFCLDAAAPTPPALLFSKEFP